jgi:hypothetical protein
MTCVADSQRLKGFPITVDIMGSIQLNLSQFLFVAVKLLLKCRTD